ncbi:MAG: hypothetical protein ACTSRZ_18040 [Promethearchaeota archaeon]
MKSVDISENEQKFVELENIRKNYPNKKLEKKLNRIRLFNQLYRQKISRSNYGNLKYLNKITYNTSSLNVKFKENFQKDSITKMYFRFIVKNQLKENFP